MIDDHHLSSFKSTNLSTFGSIGVAFPSVGIDKLSIPHPSQSSVPVHEEVFPVIYL